MLNKYTKITESMREKATELFQKYYLPRWFILTFDLVVVFCAFLLAYMLRFNFQLYEFSINLALEQSLIVVVFYAIFILLIRSYTGLIRHTTIVDILKVLMATGSAMTILIILSLITRQLPPKGEKLLVIPFSIIMIHFSITTLILFFIRMLIKIIYHYSTSSFIDKKNVVIYGAGASGVIVKRLIDSDIKGEYHIAGFLDNNKALHGSKLNDIPVYNPKVLSKEFLENKKIKTIIFAIKDISADSKNEIIKWAVNLGLEVRDTPPVESWMNGQLQMKQIKQVEIEDLLGREPIVLNLNRIEQGLHNKVILVTGAAGSIGSELVRQLCNYKTKQLILVDQAETPVFNLKAELQSKKELKNVEIVLADVSNYKKMDLLFKNYKPQIIFHAAAYKHVPIMEENPHEAIRVNVGGTQILSQLSDKYEVEKFILISTDKAVNPTNIMGASKRICEIITQIQIQNNKKTQFVITRFGNVLGSNGSVIPIFRRQIDDGGPVTITHPEVTRYFMSIPEACHLVLEAGFMGKGGEIYVFDMGEPIKIYDLAIQMIKLSGLIPDQDIKIVFTGLRPGEKMYEELLTDGESTIQTHHPKIKIANTERFNAIEKSQKINHILEDLYSMSEAELIQLCKDLVPEYLNQLDEYK